MSKMPMEARVHCPNSTVSNALYQNIREGIPSDVIDHWESCKECAEKFGNQCVVSAIDARKEADGIWHVYVAGGRKDTGIDLIEWAKKVVSLGAGEILLTSMDKDGTKSGFDLEMLNAVADVVNVPIIASGGAGNIEHMVEVFEKTTATGALAASIFHYGEVSIADTKAAMAEAGIEVRR